MDEKLKKIKDFMKRKKIKKGTLSRMMGYHPNHVGKILNGHLPLNRQFLKFLISILKEACYEKIHECENDIKELTEIEKND